MGTFADEAEQGAHNYHVHDFGHTLAGADGCVPDITGGHWKPDDGVGPSSGGTRWSDSNDRAEIGDFSGKHGKLMHGMTHNYTDSQIHLTGPFSVLGRSVVIHSTVDGARIACCNIVQV